MVFHNKNMVLSVCVCGACSFGAELGFHGCASYTHICFSLSRNSWVDLRWFVPGSLWRQETDHLRTRICFRCFSSYFGSQSFSASTSSKAVLWPQTFVPAQKLLRCVIRCAIFLAWQGWMSTCSSTTATSRRKNEYEELTELYTPSGASLLFLTTSFCKS